MDPQVHIEEEGRKEIERKPLDGCGNCGRNPYLSCNANRSLILIKILYNNTPSLIMF
jgi:hypothetical protein